MAGQASDAQASEVAAKHLPAAMTLQLTLDAVASGSGGASRLSSGTCGSDLGTPAQATVLTKPLNRIKERITVHPARSRGCR